MLRSYTRMIGKQFAHDTIGPLILEIIDNKYFFEIDPIKANPEDGHDLEENLKNLTIMAERFLDAIVNSIPKMPKDFIEISHVLCEETIKRFPTGAQAAVAGFIFLRFFGYLVE